MARSRKSKVLSIRVSNELLERIDEAYEQYTVPIGVRITKSAFVTWVVEAGLRTMEKGRGEAR